MLVNQSLWSEFDAVEELSEQAAETISGGQEVFTIYNKTRYNITHVLDGNTYSLKSNKYRTYTTQGNGIIKFDADGRAGYFQNKTYNLSEGHVYEYQDNKSTPGNPYDIELYTVA